MSITTLLYRFRLRGGLAAAVAAENEAPLAREFEIETDTQKFKLGDGSTPYNSLPYVMRDDTITLSDIVTGNATTSRHGFLKKLENDPTKFMDSQGNWAVPAGAGSAWTTVKKTADQSRAATTTLAADSALQFAAAASTSYTIRARVLFTCPNATMDFKYRWTYSGTVTTGTGAIRHSVAPGAPGGTDDQSAVTKAALIGTTFTCIGTTFGPGFIELDMVVTTNAAGTFSLDWAQNTSDAASAVVLRGSYLEYMTS